MIPPFKVLTVLGTRPEMIRLSKLIQWLDTDPRFIHKYVHTGQNDHPQLRDVFFADLGLRQPDYLFQARQSTRSKTINQMKKDIASVIRKEKPQAFLVLGDTDSALTSEVAKQFNISIFHMEAGNRCFDSRSPEEKNRKFIDAIANYNLPYSKYGQENLKNEKLVAPIFITGSPLYEVIMPHMQEVKDSKGLATLHLQAKQYLVWSTHRAEHLDDEKVFQKLLTTLLTIAKHYPDKTILVTTHPRLQKKLDAAKMAFPQNIIFHPPFGFIDYLRLQFHSLAVLSDSGSIHEEADILGFHAIHLRRRHERKEAEVIPVTYLSEFKVKLIIQHLQNLGSTPKRLRVKAYQEKSFSKKVANYIHATLLENSSVID